MIVSAQQKRKGILYAVLSAAIFGTSPVFFKTIAANGINTIGLHPFPEDSLPDLVGFIGSEEGQRFLHTCWNLGIQVEYEIHALNHLLPRTLFDKNPEMFRMDDSGQRIREINMCPSHPGALELVVENAVELSRKLKPTIPLVAENGIAIRDEITLEKDLLTG